MDAENTTKTNTLDGIMDAVHELKQKFTLLSDKVDAIIVDIRRSLAVTDFIREAYVNQGTELASLRMECMRRAARCPASFVTPPPTPLPGSNGGEP